MKISKLKKYVSLNIVSFIGYFSIIIFFIFLILLGISSAGTTIRADINEVFYEYIANNVLKPYFDYYSSQLFIVGVLIMACVYENLYYKQVGKFGLKLFENQDKLYSSVFVTGLVLNLVPAYIFFMVLTSWAIYAL